MDLKAYKALDENEQLEILLETGVLLLDRNDRTCCYLLYQIGGFYVEVTQQLDDYEISGLRPFGSTDLLQPWLEDIKIEI